MAKPVPVGVTFSLTLQFGDWPIDKVEKIITSINKKYDLSNHEIKVVDRGSYVKCRGYGEHKACNDLIPSHGAIIWKHRGYAK